MWLLVGLATAAPLATCARAFDTEELTQAIDAAEAAFREQDAKLFDEEEEAIVERLGCIRDPLTAEVIGRIHRVHALGAFLRQDDARRDAALGGVLDTDPEAMLPPELIPGGHPVRIAFERLLESGDDGGHRTLLTPGSGWFEVDGKALGVAPIRHDAVIQRIDGDGKVVETRLVLAGASLSDWSGEVAPAVVVGRHAGSKPAIKWQRVGFGIGTGVALAGAGALYAVATGAKASALDVQTPLADAEGDRDVANATTWGWIGSAAAAAGLGAALVFTW